ncbi:hypothetical protein Plec18167_000626 [Paecilomyces lecythidis]|uniref:Myb-like DNA-binding domain-containing protein n=1 Tax=Paecilomyces lecythidis TaxID=3004212 RepID=A0ABR3YFR8_9EURO
MPSKIQQDVNLRFLYSCLQNSDYKSIDFRAVGGCAGIKAPAARMRFSRLKRQIEQGSMDQDTRAGCHKDDTSRAEKAEKKTEADNNPTLDSGADFLVTKTSTGSGNTAKNLQDIIEYETPPEADKIVKNGSDGSPYEAGQAYIETDEDVPLAKRIKTTRKAKVHDLPVNEYAGRDEDRQERSRTHIEPPRNQSGPPGVETEILDNDEDQASSPEKHALEITDTWSASNQPTQTDSKGKQQTSNEGADRRFKISKRIREIVKIASSEISRTATPEIGPGNVFQHQQFNDGYTTYPFSRPFPSSFRSQPPAGPRGPATTYSFGPRAIENNPIDPIIRPPFFRSDYKMPQNSALHIETAKTPESSQTVQGQSELKNTNHNEATMDETFGGCDKSETGQSAVKRSTEPQELVETPPDVIDLERGPE